MVKIFESHIITVLYPNLCYKEVCYKGTALYLKENPNCCFFLILHSKENRISALCRSISLSVLYGLVLLSGEFHFEVQQFELTGRDVLQTCRCLYGPYCRKTHSCCIETTKVLVSLDILTV